MYDWSRSTTRVGPTCSGRPEGTAVAVEDEPQLASGRSALPAWGPSRTRLRILGGAAVEGGLQATRSSSYRSSGMPSARRASIENPFASAVSVVLATAATYVSDARRPAEPRSTAARSRCRPRSRPLPETGCPDAGRAAAASYRDRGPTAEDVRGHHVEPSSVLAARVATSSTSPAVATAQHPRLLLPRERSRRRTTPGAHRHRGTRCCRARPRTGACRWQRSASTSATSATAATALGSRHRTVVTSRGRLAIEVDHVTPVGSCSSSRMSSHARARGSRLQAAVQRAVRVVTTSTTSPGRRPRRG